MVAFPLRYAIYFADLNPTVGGEIRKVRPVVVVSQNEMNQFLDTGRRLSSHLRVASSVAEPAANPMRGQEG